MEARRRTWFDDRGLTVRRPDGAGVAAPGGDLSLPLSLPFYGGALHYWRVEPARWAACLRQIHALGLTIVETYVPWRVHEPERGRFDWRGPRDLARFLALAHAAGLAVVLRPGPHVNAELTSFGMPDHVLGEPEVQARTARGTPVWMPSPPRAWPVPSYASRRFRERVHAWYGAVADVVRPHLAPDGPIVAIGVDNEAQLFFRLGAYDFDYHPDAIAWWHEANELGEGGTDPPRAWSDADAARCVSWVRFKDHYIARSLGELSKLLDDVGLDGIARFHNLPPGHHGLYEPRRIQAAIGGPVGIDAYTSRADFVELRRRATAIVGTASPIPIAFEVGVGFFPWFPPLDEPVAAGTAAVGAEASASASRSAGGASGSTGAGTSGSAGASPSRSGGAGASGSTGGGASRSAGTARGLDERSLRERDQLLTLLAAGVRGFNLFMAVERDRYYGAAIDATGTLEPHASWIRPLIAALAEVDWPGLRRTAGHAFADVPSAARSVPIALVATRADARFGIATSLIDPMTPVVAEVLGLGPGGAAELGTDTGAVAARRWQTAIASALELAQVAYAIIDEAATEDELARYRAVIVPTLDRADRALWQRLRAMAESPRDPASGKPTRRTIVVIGPGTPTRDELDQPLADPPPRRCGRLKQGSLDDLPGLAADLAALAGDPIDTWQIERPDDVRALAYADATGIVRVVFVANDAAKPANAVLVTDDGVTALCDPFTGERLSAAAGKATVAVTARGIRMLVIDRASR